MRRYFGLLVWLTISLSGVSYAAAAEATLRWTAPGNDGTIGQATTYDICYSTALITAANWVQATHVVNPPSPKPSGTKEVLKVTGLLPATTYYFAIKTADSRPNWSAVSNNAVKTTCPVDCVEFTGNVDGSTDGLVDLRDLSLLVVYLTGTGVSTICIEQGNVDGSINGVVDLTDLSRLVAYMTAGTPLARCL